MAPSFPADSAQHSATPPARAARARIGVYGWGIVGPGARNVAALEAHAFPVFASTIALTGATKDKRGTVGTPVRVGGVPVSLGDWVVGDVDGVTVVPRDALSQVMGAGRTREAKEAGFFAALKAGQTTVQLLDLNASLIAGAGAGS